MIETIPSPASRRSSTSGFLAVLATVAFLSLLPGGCGDLSSPPGSSPAEEGPPALEISAPVPDLLEALESELAALADAGLDEKEVRKLEKQRQKAEREWEEGRPEKAAKELLGLGDQLWKQVWKGELEAETAGPALSALDAVLEAVLGALGFSAEAEAILEVEDEVALLIEGGLLANQDSRNLMHRILKALEKLAAGRLEQVLHELDKLLDEVDRLQKRGDLEAGEGDDLRRETWDAIGVLLASLEASLEVEPGFQAVQIGEKAPYRAHLRRGDGERLEFRRISWELADPALAALATTGNGDVVATGLVPGRTAIRASAGGLEDEAELYVRSGETVVIDPDDLELISTDVERETGTFRFRILRGRPPRLEAGDIIIGAADGGFLRKIVTVSVDGDVVTYGTAFTTLEEAVGEGSFQETVTIGPGAPEEAVAGAEVHWGPNVLVSAAPGAKAVGGELSLDNTVLWQKDGLTLSIKEGLIGFTPDVDMGADIGFFTLKEFHAIATGRLDFDLLVELEALSEAQIAGQRQLAQFKRRFLVFIGGWPVAGEARLTFTAGFEAKSKLKHTTTAGFESGASVELGGRYTAASGWDGVFHMTREFDPIEPTTTVSGEAEARVYVQPKLSLFLYTVAGPEAALQPFLKGKVLFEAADGEAERCFLALTAGADATLALTAQVLGTQLGSLDRTFNLAEEPLWDLELEECGDEEEDDGTVSGEGWLASPVISSCGGFVDEDGFRWFDVLFDDGPWTPVTLPEENVLEDGEDRYYRHYFELTSSTVPVTLTLESNNGVEIYVNGSHFAEYGSGCHQSACVNTPACFFNQTVPPVQIPSSLLRTGVNVIAVHHTNSGRSSYFNLDVSIGESASASLMGHGELVGRPEPVP